MIAKNLQQFMMKQAQDTTLPSVSEKKTPEATGEATGPYRYDEHRRRGYDVLYGDMNKAMSEQFKHDKPLDALRDKYYTPGSEGDSPWYDDPRFAEARKKQEEGTQRYIDMMHMQDAYQDAANERAMLPSDIPPLMDAATLNSTIEQDIAAALGASQPKPRPNVYQPTGPPLLERLKRLNKEQTARDIEEAGKLRIGDIFKNLWYPKHPWS